MVNRAPPPVIPPASKDNGCVVVGLILGAVVILTAIGRCSSTPESATDVAQGNVSALSHSLNAAVAAQLLPPVEPLSRVAVRRGFGHVKLVMAAEGLSGAMIYSQNCYDALSRKFTWTKLDVCGAFDAQTAADLPDADTAELAKEMAYFQTETAAQRYLSAATGAGELAGEADQRLSQVQARAMAPKPVAESVPASDAEVTDRGADDPQAPGTSDPSDLLNSGGE